MKDTAIALVFLFCGSTAFARIVVPLAPFVCPDTELTEYRVLEQAQDNFVGLNVSLQFVGTVSNNVEVVALGCDVDGDGVLPFGFTDAVMTKVKSLFICICRTVYQKP